MPGAEPTPPPVWEPEQWVDEGSVREEAVAAVVRAAPARRPGELDPATAERVGAAVGSTQRATRLRERLVAAYEALERERFADARRMANALVRELTDVSAVHEIIGLANYRLGAWRQAAVALERAQSLSPDAATLPVLMDCLRALRRHRDVESAWRELKSMSPSHEVMAEGRIVMAGSFADRGELRAALEVMQPAVARPKRIRDHHLRQWYVIADLHDRAGDTVSAARFFDLVARQDPGFVDVRQRLRGLGR